MKSQNFKYIPAIDHLRGFAAMLVVFYHGVSVIFYQLRYGTPFTGITEEIWPKSESFLTALVFEGHTGVALFMVLSGFIFTIGTYGSDLNYWKFLRNRFLRTYPLFLFILIVGTYSSIFVASTITLALGISREDLIPIEKEGANLDHIP